MALLICYKCDFLDLQYKIYLTGFFLQDRVKSLELSCFQAQETELHIDISLNVKSLQNGDYEQSTFNITEKIIALGVTVNI